MNKDTLKNVIDFWRQTVLKGSVYPRELAEEINFGNKEVVDLIGVRRSGKSFLLKLLIAKAQKDWLYINFEDPFFLENNKPTVIEDLINAYTDMAGFPPKYLFFDEIQNIAKWETVVRKYRDAGGYKIFITGSSAKLLGQELATLLTGRHLSYEVFPLSFKEFLGFRGVALKNKTEIILQQGALLQHFQDYLQNGGFPEVVVTKDSDVLKQYYRDILNKDILARHDIRDREALEQMGAFLISSSGKTVSLLSLQEQYKLTFESVTSYFSLFKECFLLFELPQFSYSLRTSQRSLKKVYCIDTGLANFTSIKFSQDRGRMLENVVFLHLRRTGKKLYYFQGNNKIEADFVVKDREAIEELIQVAWEIDDPKTLDRELRGLRVAAKDLKVNKATLLTFETSGERKIGGLVVKIQPVWRWMLE